MSNAGRRALCWLGLALAGVCLAMPDHTPRALSGPDIHLRVLAGVAWVQSADRARGTGFVVDVTRRRLVTCEHVVGENDTVEVTFPWREKELVTSRRRYVEQMPELRRLGLVVRGKVIRRRSHADLALIELDRLPKGVAAIPLAEASAGPGDTVRLVGNRSDVESLWTHAAGSVRAVRTLREGYFSAGRNLARGAKTLLAGVPINEGDSGGPLVNQHAAIVGVAAAVAWEAQGAGLFIDLSELQALLEEPAPPRKHSSRPSYSRAARSTVVVQYEGGPRRAGILLDRERGLILTTARAVAKEATIEVVFPVVAP